MKKIFLTAIIAFVTLSNTDTYAQHGFGTNTPDKSSAVDIVSTKRGLLIPRIDLTSTTVASPVTNPAQSLLVYNKNTAGDVTPGFYYWENNKWVRVMSSNIAKTSSVVDGTTTNVTSTVSINDSNNTEYKVEVDEAALRLQNIGGELNPSQIAQGSNQQVLVTKVNANGDLQSVWVDASEVIGNGIEVGDGLTKTGNEIKLGGIIENPVVLDLDANGAIQIKDLPTLPATGTGAFNSNSDKIIVMNPDGTLKQASTGDILSNAIQNNSVTGNNLSATDESIVVTDGNGATLKNASIQVKDGGISNMKLKENAVTTDKIADGAVQTSDVQNAAITAEKLNGGQGIDGRIAVSNAAGQVTYQPLASTLGKTLTTDGKIVIGSNESSSLENAVLVDTNLKIKAESIGTTELTNDAVTADKINANVAGAGLQQNLTTGALEVNLTSSGIGKGLSTDNVIQITGTGATSTSSATESVLKEIGLKIGENTLTKDHIATGAVTSDEILNGTILAADMKSEGNSKVMVTDTTGNVTWIDQTALGNTVTVDNGLTKTGNNIQLGGTLVNPTKITTGGNANNNTFAIEGLQSVAVANDLVVVQKDGVLRTATRTVAASTTSTLSVSTIAGYSPYVQEVNISATAGASNFDINLPDATVAAGQIINIKLTNTTEVDGYVSIKSSTTELSYGSLPYQGWILKSNGTEWMIVGRN